MNVVPLTAVMFAGLADWALGGWSNPVAFDEGATLLVAALAVITVARAAHSARGRHRGAWVALMVGLVCWMIGEAVWIWDAAHLNHRLFPSAADAAFIMLPICACITLMLFPSAHTDRSKLRHFLDGLIVSGSLFIISWVLFINRINDFGAADRMASVVAFAYSAFNLVALTMAAALLGRMRRDQSLTIGLLTLGLFCMWFSQSAFIYLSETERVGGDFATDVGWVIGLLLIAIAAVTDREAPGRDPQAVGPGWVSIWLPYALLVLAGIVAASQPLSRLQSWPVALTVSVLVIAVLARQLLAFVENRRLLAAVAEQALRDPLTGVANRALLDYRLEQAMRRRNTEGVSVGVASLDVDDFKLLNDTLGHPAGDALLIDIARRLLVCVDSGDTVARLGGDEFVIVTEGPAERSRLIAQRVVEIFAKPFVIDSNELFVSASVGLAIAEPDEAVDASPEQLFKQADLAMYAGKRSRTGGVHNFTAKMESDAVDKGLFRRGDHRASGAATVRLLGELRHAVDHAELTLVYQPKYDLETLTVVGVEALLRWPHPRLGMLAPARFLPLVRRHGLIRPVTDLVVNKALQDASQWYESWGEVPVAVNLFAPSLADVGLRDMVIGALATQGLAGNALTVEITEDLVLDNIGIARTVLNQLRENGIRVAIDDFGSGYAALSYLRDLPIDEVKLDRDFIAPVLLDERAGAVVRAVVDLAHVLGLTTVAEGVEDAHSAERLREFGCDIAQGFYFCRPVPLEQLLQLPTTAAKSPSEPTSAILN